MTNHKFALSSEEIDQLSGAIFSSLKFDHSKLLIVGLQALQYSLSFLGSLLARDSVCDFVFETLFNTLKKSHEIQNEECMRLSILRIEELSSLIYANFGKYSPLIFQQIANCQSIRSAVIIQTSIHFFQKMLENDARHGSTLVDVVFKQLYEQTIQIMLQLNYDDEANWPVQNYCVQFLGLLNARYLSQVEDLLISKLTE